MIRRAFLAVAMAALLAACMPQAPVSYPVPIAEAKPLLLASGFPPMVFGAEPPIPEVRAEGASDIVWIAKRDGAEIFRYVAHVTEDGPGATRVSLELKGAEGVVAKRLAEHPEIKNLYLVAMKEQVAATLEHRDFEMSAVNPMMMAAAIENMGALRASADQAAEASAKADRANIDKAYADEAAGRR